MTAAEAPERGHRRLSEPRDGLTPVIDRIQPLLSWCEAAAAASEEPVAVDVERASSYRYSARAYLIQLRTASAGTALIDPVAFTIPETLRRTLQGREWILHAATQDLPSLAELDLRPDVLFDTELAARLLGMERVSLGAVVEDTQGLVLAKEHSAADWSRRPLPASWLTYAALDVEVLVEVRDVLARRLAAEGKTRWAREEFEHLRTRTLPARPAEPWRAMRGVGVLRSTRQMAAARAMWERRDQIARHEDLSPHLVIKDRAIVAAAKAAPQGKAAFDAALPAQLRKKDIWWKAARSGVELPASHLPARAEPSDPPAHKLWAKKFPEVWERYLPLREIVGEQAEELHLPTENLLTPGVLRTWVWQHPESADPARLAAEGPERIAEQLRDLGARPWQAEIVGEVLARRA
ncbi:HRDC domain-containing protein [Brachybacterium hainanense]|uniref:HRDC domain-containing protein n=1 Tax=Brachybacterium hainanense TaxID=1541174 RepID=A0ABV6RGB4_9MICO